MNIPKEQQRVLLLRVARRALAERGLESDFSAEALAEAVRTWLDKIQSFSPFLNTTPRPEASTSNIPLPQ